MNSFKLNINGQEFEIINNNGIFSYYKILDNKKFSPTAEELKIIFEEINKLNNQKMSLEEIKKQLEIEIQNNNITNTEQLENYLNTLGVVQEKEELLNFGKKLLTEKNLKFTPTEMLCQDIINEFKNAMTMGKKMLIDFKVVDATLEEKYMEVSVSTLKDNTRFDFPTKYVRFDDGTKKELIEEILKEVILSSKLEYSKFQNVNDFINDRVNYFLKTIQNCFINVKNIESYYQRELEELISNLRVRFGDNNTPEMMDKINDELTEEQLADEKDLGYDGPKLIRKKDEKKGFINSSIVFIITEFIASLFILLQIVLLK